MQTKKLTRLSMLLALSLVLGILESFLPILNGMIPGIKLGLANIPVLVTLYLFGAKEAIFVSFMRVLLMGLLRTGLFTISFYFSLFGAFFSIFIMILAKKSNWFSLVGISMLGAIFHTLGQMIAVLLFLKTTAMLAYLPILLCCSIGSGLLIGFCSKELLEILEKQLRPSKNMI